MAVLNASARDISPPEAADSAEPLAVEAAYERSECAALADSRVGAVGLEIETHLVDLDAVADRVPWDRAAPLPGIIGSITGSTVVTLEPGGQVELSSTPALDVTAAVTGLRREHRTNLGGLGLRPAPVGSYPAGASAYGAEQMIGDVWEWTSSDFGPWPGFSPMIYRRYSEPFFGRDYKVLRGGSWAVATPAIRPSFRNWDFPIRRQIFAGMRLAWDA